MTNPGQHGQKGFNQHSGVPLTAFAQFQVGGRPMLFGKVRISKDQHLMGNRLHQFLKSRTILNVGREISPFF